MKTKLVLVLENQKLSNLIEEQSLSNWEHVGICNEIRPLLKSSGNVKIYIRFGIRKDENILFF